MAGRITKDTTPLSPRAVPALNPPRLPTLLLPFKYRSACALHRALLRQPPGTMGELWGPSSLIMRATLANQSGVGRLEPVGWVDLTATSTDGREWDSAEDIPADYRWAPLDDVGFAPIFSEENAPGLTVATAPASALYCPSLARHSRAIARIVTITRSVTWSGSPAALVPYIYAGLWHAASGFDAGLIAAGGIGEMALPTWRVAYLNGDPGNPTVDDQGSAEIAPSNEALILRLDCSQTQTTPIWSATASWPRSGAGMGQASGSDDNGAAGDRCALVLGCRAGDAGGAAAKVTWVGFQFDGDLS